MQQRPDRPEPERGFRGALEMGDREQQQADREGGHEGLFDGVPDFGEDVIPVARDLDGVDHRQHLTL